MFSVSSDFEMGLSIGFSLDLLGFPYTFMQMQRFIPYLAGYSHNIMKRSCFIYRSRVHVHDVVAPRVCTSARHHGSCFPCYGNT